MTEVASSLSSAHGSAMEESGTSRWVHMNPWELFLMSHHSLYRHLLTECVPSLSFASDTSMSSSPFCMCVDLNCMP
ncbi:FK506 binding protein 1a, isoform CRA_c [Rattus norvegicus]|uniref:FK506 binding protein 1a, isoform CRA_c n=1 Tax=Rattus norvegicus TaxID=10116 RepID=A6KHJ0_RAT|nr:FK506 binding protein 1a, isoform CRA_c [Rattus norvegicus]EDL86118.1 FK506 binding protein 1a, isoform CRA_c [Rattus norvegicus]EDL86119.1 FK506 binding protein 1a, isoform CRA_c [Rattus norvegicus]